MKSPTTVLVFIIITFSFLIGGMIRTNADGPPGRIGQATPQIASPAPTPEEKDVVKIKVVPLESNQDFDHPPTPTPTPAAGAAPASKPRVAGIDDLAIQAGEWIYSNVVAPAIDSYLGTYDSSIGGTSVFIGGRPFNQEGYDVVVTRTVKGSKETTHRLEFLILPTADVSGIVRIIPLTLEVHGQKAQRGTPTSAVVTITVKPPQSAISTTLTYTSAALPLEKPGASPTMTPAAGAAATPTEQEKTKNGDDENARKNEDEYDTVYFDDENRKLKVDDNGKSGANERATVRSLNADVQKLAGSDMYGTPSFGAFTITIGISESNKDAEWLKTQIDKYVTQSNIQAVVTDLTSSSSSGGGSVGGTKGASK